jgi:hypothetical protein
MLRRSVPLQQRSRFRPGPVLTAQLLLEQLDLALIPPGAAFGGSFGRAWSAAVGHWHQVPPARWPRRGSGRLPPAVHLFGE